MESKLVVAKGWGQASQAALVVKNPSASAGDVRDGLSPCGGQTPWSRAGPPTPAPLPGAPRGQRSLAGCSPRAAKTQTQLKCLACTHAGLGSGEE